ncbi:MAG: septal ring lytic transglycosylase RlpA family protein [Rhodospirillaceae bacterium]|jgi:rare lipoprotein A|nr:septal ring lytic transglycosylase RlpA family protein [Rhodospirillaceae bacterium]MBT6137728.1 septal ring lytic transglycosylase RlpA family protein [Rhodospirillaceae bacterium]
MILGRGRVLIALTALTVMLSGCAETELIVHTAKRITNISKPPKSEGRYKVGSPYQIKGVWYYPRVDYGYRETGIASWYGPNFHQKRTANGEIFDQNALTAAHRTLPMPSAVRVTNLGNGRSIVLRVNDRGPFAHGRIIDLSRRAAQLLGYERQGTARVRVEILAEESRRLVALAKQGKIVRVASSSGPVPLPVPVPPATPKISVSAAPLAPLPDTDVSVSRVPEPPRKKSGPSAVELSRQAEPGTVATQPVKDTRIFVQVAAFSNRGNADLLLGRLSGVGHARVHEGSVAGKQFYRVRFGPLTSVAAADRILDGVIGAGYPGAQIIVD